VDATQSAASFEEGEFSTGETRNTILGVFAKTTRWQGSVEQRTSLGQITKEKAQDHGQEADTPKLSRMHFQDLPQPTLHGLRGGNIGKPLQNKNKTYQGYKKFHAPSITKKLEPPQPPQKLLKMDW